MTADNTHILVVDDEPDIRELLNEILEDEGFTVTTAGNAKTAREARRKRKPDLTLLDIWMPDCDGISLLKEWSHNQTQFSPVIIMSGHGTVETAVEATRLGAYDFIEKPLSIAKLLVTVRNALESTQLWHDNINLRRASHNTGEPIGRSAAIQKLCERIRRVADYDTPVLFTGESGTGKELFARYMHDHSKYAAGPFVRIRTAGLKEAELFGVESPSAVHYGAVEQANNGTLFFDEIVDLDIDLQARLVSVLQHQSFLRVNGVEPVYFSDRVAASTRHDPAMAIQRGQLREDLYHHLNGVPIHISPLRERKEDVSALFGHYVSALTERESLPYRRLTASAQNRLRNYSWPGNVRELINVLQRLLILGSGTVIELDEVDAAIGLPAPSAETDATGSAVIAVAPEYELPLKEAREQFERGYLEYQIRINNGRISRIAKHIGVDRTYLYRKLRMLGIDPKHISPDDE